MHHFQQQHWVATCKSRNADPTAILSRTHVQAVPENQRREAIFKGLCIARKWRGWRSTFTVRNFITGGGGIERTFQLYVSIRPATSCCSTAGNQCRVAGVFLLNVPLQRARCMVHQISSLFCPSRCMHTGFQSAGLGWVGLACAHTSLKNLRSLSQPHVCQELSSAKSVRAMGACMHCYVIGPHPGLAVIPRHPSAPGQLLQACITGASRSEFPAPRPMSLACQTCALKACDASTHAGQGQHSLSGCLWMVCCSLTLLGGMRRRYTPHILQIKVIKSMQTRRAKLYYMRKRQPREYRV